MPFIGNQLSTSFQNVETQTITGDGSTSYTLNNAVADGKDLLVYINNVKQEEGSGKSYTATGTTITFTEAVASTDSCYVVFIGQAIGTVTPQDGSIVSSMLADANLEMPNTLDLNGKELILDADADTSITADTDDQIDIKIAGSDNLRIKANEIENVSGDFTLDVAGDITLDANGQQIYFAKNGTTFGQFGTESTPSNFTIESTVSDGDIVFKGSDGGSGITAMTIDMSAGGFVGIGESSPANLLHVKASDVGAAPIDTALMVLEKSGTNYLSFMGANTNVQGVLFGDADDNDVGQLLYNHSSNHMAFNTNGSERMRIDSSGRVTIAAIPSFFAKHNQSISSSQTPVIFNIASHNTGSHYDTSTGVFTCPVAGLYYFAAFGIFGQQNGATYGDYKIQQNGNDFAKGHFNNPADVRWEQVHVSAIIPCSANDAIRVVFIPSSGTPDFYQDYNAFQGYLIG